VAQNPRIIGFRGRFLFGVLLVGGSIAIGGGFLEVLDTQFDLFILPHNKIVAPFFQPLIGYTHVTEMNLTLTTNDVFTVNNMINGTVDVNVIDPENISQTFILVFNHDNAGKFETNDQKMLNNLIAIWYKNHQGTFSKQLGISTGGYFIESKFTFTAYSEDPVDVLVYLQTRDGTWEYLGAQDFPTIQPINVMTELKNSKIVEGLTWVIVGAIPVGLVSEFYIHSRLENHFYQVEKSERDSKKQEPTSDPNRYRDG
jgi:hypothetical protein